MGKILFVLSVILMATIVNAISLSVGVSNPYATSYPILLEPGTKNAIITVNIESTARIYDLTASIEVESLPFTGVVSTKEIGDLSAFITLPVSFTIDVDEDATPNTQYPVPIRFYFKDVSDDEANYTKTFYITVTGKEIIELEEVVVPTEMFLWCILELALSHSHLLPSYSSSLENCRKERKKKLHLN
jgi:hypothetical protein